MRLTAVVLTVVVMGTNSAAAQNTNTRSGNYMLPHCKHFLLDNYNYDVWDGDCGGILSALIYFGESLSPNLRICAPRGSTQSQAARIVIAYLEQNPAQTHLDFRGLSHTALQKAWPCRSKVPSQ